jgi:exosome complex RNA-binding protein Csl4
MLKKIIVCLCSLVLVLSLAGCSTKSSAAEKPAISQPVVKADVPKKELITVSKLTFKPQYKNIAEIVMGTATNNNKMDVDVTITVVYTNADGTPLMNEHIWVGTIKAGETKNFDDFTGVTDVNKTIDLEKATYKIQIEDFIQKTDGTW